MDNMLTKEEALHELNEKYRDLNQCTLEEFKDGILTMDEALDRLKRDAGNYAYDKENIERYFEGRPLHLEEWAQRDKERAERIEELAKQDK